MFARLTFVHNSPKHLLRQNFPPREKFPGGKRHININFLLWLTSRWPWDKRPGRPRVNRAKKFMCSTRNTGNISFSLWLTGGLSQGCPDFQKVYVFKVYVRFSCLKIGRRKFFPLKDNFPLRIAFPFPQNGQFSHEMKGLRKRSFYGLRDNL